MSLKEFFSASDHGLKPEFDALLDEINSSSKYLSYLADVKPGTYHCVSASFETLTKYPSALLESEGVSFYPPRVDPSTILYVMQTQAEMMSRALEPDYDQSAPNLGEMHFTMKCGDGSIEAFSGLLCPLRYNNNREIELAICVGFFTSQEYYMRPELEDKLARLKSLYWKLYSEPSTPKGRKKPLVEIVISTSPNHNLTDKESEVLSFLSNGSTTKEIALQLDISENTVETHRRNMLAKFEARNTADLVKKASKLYWLE